MWEKRQNHAGILVAAAVTLAVTTMTYAADDEKEVYSAFAVQMGGGPSGASGTLQITITRWSTAEERQMLLTLLKEKGHDEFMKALRKQKETGYVQGTGAIARANPFPSTRLHAAWQYEKDGKREVVLVTNRPIGMREAASAARSLDYDTSVLLMEFPSSAKDAQGSGKLHMALKVDYDDKKKRLDIEKMGSGDTRLTKINRRE